MEDNLSKLFLICPNEPVNKAECVSAYAGFFLETQTFNVRKNIFKTRWKGHLAPMASPLDHREEEKSRDKRTDGCTDGRMNTRTESLFVRCPNMAQIGKLSVRDAYCILTMHTAYAIGTDCPGTNFIQRV
jgi:hypothetical protein